MKYLLEKQETSRLKFRLLEEGDFNIWIDLFKEEGVSRFLGLALFPTPQMQCEEWFKRIKQRYNDDLGGMNVLINKSTNEFIGQCGLLIQVVDGITEMEIGYSILPRHWNKGYATEAARKCRDYAFENDYSDSLVSIVHIDNIKSKQVALKNGMILSKTTTFKEMPVNVFRISKSGWLNNYRNKSS